ncbi:MAG: oligosaccharide flippase family protein [Bacteroidia bacterium]
MLKRLRGMSEFTRNVLKVFSGSMLVNIFSFATLPLITYLYDPETYGLYSLILASFSIFNGMSSLRYDTAIVVMGNNRLSNYMSMLSFVVLILFTALLTFFLGIGSEAYMGWMNASEVLPYVWLIPVFVIFTGYRLILNGMASVARHFTLLTVAGIVMAVIMRAFALLFGLFSPTFFSLCLAHILAFVVVLVYMSTKHRLDFHYFQPRRLLVLAKKNWKYPVYETSSAFVNSLALWLPVFMLSGYFGPAIVGLFNMADRLLDRPFRMLANALGSVYFPTASQVMLDGKAKRLLGLYKQILFRLVMLFLPLFLAVYLVSPWLEGFLGEKWAGAGLVIQILVVIRFFHTLNTPFAKTFVILGRQELGFVLGLISLVMRFAAMWLFRETYTSMLWAFSISGALYYAANNFIIYLLIRMKARE